MPKLALAIAVAVLSTGSAQAQNRGGGSGESATALPPKRDLGPREERAELPPRRLPFQPPHALPGTPVVALDWSGSRFGPAPVGRAPTYGEAPPAVPAAEMPSGDFIRSASSADVREARRERAPDVEVVTGASPQMKR